MMTTSIKISSSLEQEVNSFCCATTEPLQVDSVLTFLLYEVMIHTTVGKINCFPLHKKIWWQQKTETSINASNPSVKRRLYPLLHIISIHSTKSHILLSLIVHPDNNELLKLVIEVFSCDEQNIKEANMWWKYLKWSYNSL